MSPPEPEDSESNLQATIDQYRNTTSEDTSMNGKETEDNTDTDPNPKPKTSEDYTDDLLRNPHELPDHIAASASYDRVSTDDQYENGKSLERQVEKTCKAIEEDDDAVLIHEPIIDDGETGTNFRRSGIKKVFDLASHGILDRLYVTKLNRIGRCAPETLYFIHKLQNDMDVTIVVERNDIDITANLDDLLSATVSILSGHFSVEKRVKGSIKSQIDQFKDDRDWRVFHNQAPLGYQETEDGWIKVSEEEAQVIRELVEYFVKNESYTETAEYISRKYGDDGYELTRHQVKRVLKRDVYIGRPSKTLDTDRVKDNKVVVNDPSLKIVDADTFEEAQEIVQAKKEKYSSSEETYDPLDFVQIVGLGTMLTTFANLKLHCPYCGSTDLQDNASRKTYEFEVHNYKCKDCGRQVKWPNQTQIDRLRDQGYF